MLRKLHIPENYVVRNEIGVTGRFVQILEPVGAVFTISANVKGRLWRCPSGHHIAKYLDVVIMRLPL